MPLTSHRKGSRDGGSALSSPARSPESVVLEAHSPINQVRCSNSGHVLIETIAKSQVGVSTSCGHGSEERLTNSRSLSNPPSTGWEMQSHSERSMSSVSHSYYHRAHHQHHGFGWGEKDKVTLLVDGKRFIINPNMLTKHPNTMLGRCVW